MERQTTLLKKEETSNRKCYLVDATDKPLGRLATQIARILIGKNKPSYTPNVDCGDQVIVVNCEKVHLSGNNKLNQKTYYNVSGYTGGMRKRTAKVMLQNYPEEMFKRVIKGMLPKGRLGRKMIKKLYVYKGSEHKIQGLQPETVELVEKVKEIF